MMPKINKIYIALAALIISLHFSAFGQDTGRTVASTWQVLKYDLNVTLPQDGTRRVASRAVLTIKNVSGKPASTLTLRISPLAEVASVKIGDSIADFSKAEEKINSASNLQRIATRFGAAAADAILTVTVEYKIGLKDNSAVGSVSGISSQFLPLSYWYPTPNSWFFTRGADVAPVRLTVTAPTGQSVVSSGTETNGVFDKKLLGQPFFLTGNWELSNQSSVSVYMPKGVRAEGQKRASELAKLLVDAKTFVAGMLGKTPDVPLRIVAVRRGGGFGSGGTVLVDEAVFRRGKIDSLTVMNIAESMAKLSLGNAISVNGEGYGIIGEGLSRYIATQFVETNFGKDVCDVERLRQRTAYAAVSKRDAPMAIVSPIDDYYFPVVANKGAMAWRILAKRAGVADFWSIIRTKAQDGNLNVSELREAFSTQKELIEHLFDQVTDMNLRVGLPQLSETGSKVALLNSGAAEVVVDVVATTAAGERLTTSATIKAKSYGDAIFKSTSKIVRVEIDTEKLYPQSEYSDDITPSETKDSDPLIAAKRYFDKQEFVNCENIARNLLREIPRFDDLRILLGRALLAQNKNSEAEKEFRAVLDEKAPTSRSLAWANLGLGEVAAKAKQNDVALKFAELTIAADAEYGASYSARNLRNRLGFTSTIDPSVKSFFAEFDKAASSNRKADVEFLSMPGEVTRFVNGLSGSTEQWQTEIRHIDQIDSNTLLVETNMTVKLLSKEVETGIAVYRLSRAGNSWKLSAVDMFEVR